LSLVGFEHGVLCDVFVMPCLGNLSIILDLKKFVLIWSLVLQVSCFQSVATGLIGTNGGLIKIKINRQITVSFVCCRRRQSKVV
jgi:hypothetical protein